MMPNQSASVYVTSIDFKGGATLNLSDNSIVVLFGPNNSGKSLSLREIFKILKDDPIKTKSISNIEIHRVGNIKQLKEAVEPYKNKIDDHFYIGNDEYSRTAKSTIEIAWDSDAHTLGELTAFFVAHLTTENRLGDSNPVDSFDATKVRAGIHPIHSLYLDSDKEIEISSLFRHFFDRDLVIHRSPGRKIPLYVGERPPLIGTETATSRTYLDKVEALEPLQLQGDGFRSFASIILRVWTGNHSIILVDEPEAFLHPPQARAVGELISVGSNFEKQVFISTHSNEVIQGLLSKFADRVSVVRLDGRGGSYSARSLSTEQIADLWRDPILRYSNILNGLFHDSVVVTEADGDCRFYEAVADAQGASDKSIFYTYAGGKDRIAIIVKALRALHVPVHVVVDIDIFADDGALRDIVSAYGSDWEDYKRQVTNIRTIIQSKKSWLIGEGFKIRLRAIMETINDNEVVKSDVLRRISSAMRETSPWEAIKEGGVAAIPSGDPAKQLSDLISRLREIGIYVVPVGQMERFCKSVGRHGPKWVMEVLKRDLKQDPELQDARDFTSNLTNFYGPNANTPIWSDRAVG